MWFFGPFYPIEKKPRFLFSSSIMDLQYKSPLIIFNLLTLRVRAPLKKMKKLFLIAFFFAIIILLQVRFHNSYLQCNLHEYQTHLIKLSSSSWVLQDFAEASDVNEESDINGALTKSKKHHHHHHPPPRKISMSYDFSDWLNIYFCSTCF